MAAVQSAALTLRAYGFTFAFALGRVYDDTITVVHFRIVRFCVSVCVCEHLLNGRHTPGGGFWTRAMDGSFCYVCGCPVIPCPWLRCIIMIYLQDVCVWITKLMNELFPVRWSK